MKKKSAFTLAEVLITLAIVGIIAAITIPSLVVSVQNDQSKTAWKKAYAVFYQATSLLLRERGGSFKATCDGASTTTEKSDCFKNMFMPYLNFIKVCDNNDLSENCWFKTNQWKQLNNGAISQYVTDSTGFILADGTLVNFNMSGDCNTDCGTISVDVNGFKGPNILGKDGFQIHVYDSYLRPFGHDKTTQEVEDDCNVKLPGATGSYCSLLYLYQ